MSGSQGVQIWTVSSQLKIATGTFAYKILSTQKIRKIPYFVRPALVKCQVLGTLEIFKICTGNVDWGMTFLNGNTLLHWIKSL